MASDPPLTEETQEQAAAPAEEPALTEAESQVIPTAHESSVLITTREAHPSAAEATEPADTTPRDRESLEPIPAVSDRSPELADLSPTPTASTTSVTPAASTTDSNADDEAERFGAALATAAKPQRPAAKPADARATSIAAPATRASLPYEPAKFDGIIVGQATKAELIAAWGEPVESISTADGAILTYDTEPFQSVEVLLVGDQVAAIKIALSGDLDPAQLSQQLALDQIDPVTVSYDDGTLLGQAFPERGVVLMFAQSNGAIGTSARGAAVPSSKKVSHVAIQPLDSRAFALRAENRLHGPYEKNIDDLRTAVLIDPDFAHAHWLLAEVYLATGQADLAEAAATEAMEIEPENAAYQLRRGQALHLLGEYDEAVLEVRAVLDRTNVPPILRAQALHEMARLASMGDAQIAAKAIAFDSAAIEIADSLATSTSSKERRAAKQLLVEAHLSIAEEVARQSFNNKLTSIQQWIGRASGLAEDYIDNDGGSIELRLRVAQRALAALASFKPTLDPAPWVAEAEEAARLLRAQSSDDLWQRHIQWELGIAYLNALRVDHLRRETTTALAYGQKAIENLADGAATRQAVHASEQLVGQLYFHVGAVHAVHQQDHAKAVLWYEKAAPLLTSDRPVSELYSPRRDGEVLVSMGVTYWHTGQRDRALELTRAGVDLVELAVEDGILAKSSLAVPYGNLASMYYELGQANHAARYTELAKTAGAASAAAARPTTQRSNMPRPTTSARRTTGGAGGQAYVRPR